RQLIPMLFRKADRLLALAHCLAELAATREKAGSRQRSMTFEIIPMILKVSFFGDLVERRGRPIKKTLREKHFGFGFENRRAQPRAGPHCRRPARIISRFLEFSEHE